MHTYKQIDFSDYDSVFDDLLLDSPRTNLLSDKSASIVTMGSCFAGNLAKSLASIGFNAKTLAVSEHLNTPVINNLFMDFLVNGPSLEDAEGMSFILNDQRKDGASIEQTHQVSVHRIISAKIFVLTLGVGFLWLNKDKKICASIDGKKISEYHTAFPTPEQQYGVLKIFIEKLRKFNPSISIFLTVSPVPINICTNPRSQIIADCLSKSNLRLAAQQIVDKHKDVYYFPSFEFFRWASGHSNRAFFGSDGIVRHPDVDLVNFVVSKFIQINGGALTQNSIKKQEETV